MPRRPALSPFARAAVEYSVAHNLFAVLNTNGGAEPVLPSSFPRVVVALSGGPDSCALLLALCEAADRGLAPRPVGAAHFHHGLRGADADADAAFAAALAARLGVPCVIGLGNARPAPGQSPHDAARAARYAFFKEAAADLDANLVATAHTKDDQAETVLMRVLRGTGVDGLAGIPPRRVLSPSLAVVRPLLSQTRAEVEAYCQARGIEPRRDPSNENSRYTRARVRAVLPVLAAEFNPRLPDALARLADNAAGDAALLTKMADELWNRVVDTDGYPPILLQLAPLRDAPAPLRRRVLLRALAFAAQINDATSYAGDAENALTHIALELTENVLMTNDGARRADLPGGLVVSRDNTKENSYLLIRSRADEANSSVFFLTPTPPPKNDYRLPLVVGGPLVIVPPGTSSRADIRAVWRGPNDAPVERRRGATAIEIAADEWAENQAKLNGDNGTMAATPDDSPRLVVRPPRAGERFAPLGMKGKTRLVRDMFADADLLWHERFPHPVVALENDDGSDGEILWIVGVAQAERTRITDGTRRIIRLQVVN